MNIKEELDKLFTNVKIYQIEEYDNNFSFDVVCENFDKERTRFLSHIPIQILLLDWKERYMTVSVKKKDLEHIPIEEIRLYQNKLDHQILKFK